MSTESKPAAPNMALVWTGRVISALPVLGLAVSAAFKFLGPVDVLKEFDRLGYKPEHAFPLGIVEIACAILYAIPQTSVLGAVLLTGYLGGAVATHVRIGDSWVQVASPIIMGVLVWLGLFLREPRLRAMLPWRS